MPISELQQSQIDDTRSAARGYIEAEHFYDGKVEEIYASPRVRQMLQKSGLNDLDAINFAKIPVNALCNRLEISGISAKSAEGTDLSDHIKAIQDRNLMEFFQPDAHKKTSSLGDCYLFVWPVTDKNDNAIGVDIRINSPMTTRVFYDDEDPLRKESAVKVWTYPLPNGRAQSRANFYYPDRIERYVTGEQTDGHGKTSDDWVRYKAKDDKKDWLIPNPHDEVPIFHMRNDFPYGIPDNREAYVPQIMINKLVISHASTIDFQNFPQRYFLMDPSADDTMGGSDSDADFPMDDDNDPESPYNRSRFRADPGEVWVATARQAGQFQAADASTFIEPFNRYVLSIAQVTETPLHEFEPGGQPPSGESLKIAEMPLVNRCNMRKVLCGATWADLYAFALELMGFPGAVVVINWKSSASQAGQADWELAITKLRAGVPREVVFVEMGYDPETMKTWQWGGSSAVTADMADLDYGTILIDERRAQLGLEPLPDGAGQVRASSATPAVSGPSSDGQLAGGEDQPVDDYTQRMMDEFNMPEQQEPSPVQ